MHYIKQKAQAVIRSTLMENEYPHLTYSVIFEPNFYKIIEKNQKSPYYLKHKPRSYVKI